MSSSSYRLTKARPGEELEGITVSYWIGPTDLADLLRKSPRTLERWRKKGLPSKGSGPSRRYAFPHSIWWTRAFRIASEEQPGGVRYISMTQAAAEHYSWLESLEFQS
jgi:hypothetical protein